MIGAAKDAIEKYGSGVASVRFICGTQQIHKVRLNIIYLLKKKILNIYLFIFF